MLSGRPLVIGNNAQEILHAVVTKVPPPLSQLNDSLPKGLDAVLAKGLEKDRRERFDSAEEFADALGRAAPELSGTKRTKIGKFVGSIFPSARGAAEDLVRSAIARHHTDEPTRMAASPEFEPTHAGQREATKVAAPEDPPLEATAMVPESYQPTALYLPTSMVVAPPKRTNWMVMAVCLIAAVIVVALAIALTQRPPPAVEIVRGPEIASSPLPIAAEAKVDLERPATPDPATKLAKPTPRKAAPERVVQDVGHREKVAPPPSPPKEVKESPAMAAFNRGQYDAAWKMLLAEAPEGSAGRACVDETLFWDSATSDRRKFEECHAKVRKDRGR
jgi:hypothetical protein